jgi:hypothetical protein
MHENPGDNQRPADRAAGRKGVVEHQDPDQHHGDELGIGEDREPARPEPRHAVRKKRHR